LFVELLALKSKAMSIWDKLTNFLT
jgi:hypothetical protein